MSEKRSWEVRLASSADVPDIARLLYDFNVEFESATPRPDVLVGRVQRVMADDAATWLLAGDGPDGLAQLRFRPAIFSEGLDAHLEELYVEPAMRGNGMGRALLEAAMQASRRRGATRIDLGTSENDTEALSLYRSAGFTDREETPDGPVMLYFEREL